MRKLQKNPGGRCGLRQGRRHARPLERMAQRARRPARARPDIVSGSGMDGQGEHPRDLPPASPARQFVEQIGAHQPHEARAWKATLQRRDGVAAEAGAKLRLDPGRDDAAAIGDGPRRGEAGCERRHAGARLERVAGRDQKPDLIESQSAAALPGNQAVAGMRGVEGSAQEPNAHPPPVAETRRLRSTRRAGAVRGGSGHCPQRDSESR